LTRLFGTENLSSVSRQEMAARRATIAALNGKLLNVIFDGEMAYIKDSAAEKTLIAGEPLDIELKYENLPTTVQTNALFIEALNQEPKARDKSSALQKRLIRFRFPKVFEIDKDFERTMTSERSLGALLSLLIDHYVQEHEIADKLKPVAGSLALQVEQMWINSPVLQYLQHLQETDLPALHRLQSGQVSLGVFLASFKPWAKSQDLPERSDGDLLFLVKQVCHTTMTGGESRILGLRPETEVAL